jgi:hypothetical protein
VTTMRTFCLFLLGLSLWWATFLVRAAAQTNQSGAKTPVSAVPFQGCKSDGQVGPLPEPRVPDKTIQLDPAETLLTYYKAENGPGVLGPRGWNCFGTYGSAGSALFVTPGSLDFAFLSSPGPGIAGPAIQFTVISGGTSGRFSVAQVAARVFPALNDFVQSVVNEGIVPASDFPLGPYPADRLIYRSDRIVEYETAPNSRGLGTVSRLEQNSDPISGVAIIRGPETYLIHLTMRLPAGMRDLETSIIRQAEKPE